MSKSATPRTDHHLRECPKDFDALVVWAKGLELEVANLDLGNRQLVAQVEQLDRSLSEAHRALDAYDVARGAGGHSVRYRIGLLVESLTSSYRSIEESGWAECVDIPNIKGAYIHCTDFDRPIITRTSDGRWWTHPGLPYPTNSRDNE